MANPEATRPEPTTVTEGKDFPDMTDAELEAEMVYWKHCLATGERAFAQRYITMIEREQARRNPLEGL